MLSLAQELYELKTQFQFRSLTANSQLIDVASNDYLGLSTNAEIKRVLINALQAGCPLGAGGSRLLGGHWTFHQDVETFLAQTFGAEASLLFSSGYAANVGVLSMFASDDTEYFSDKLNHASLIDGIRLARSPHSIFQHNNMNHLEEFLSKSQKRRKVIVTESVFSMDGDLSPLDDLTALANRYDAWLMIDEAHATGVFGRQGLGRLSHLKLNRKIISLHTLGKAIGAQGAFILCSQEVRDYVINKARSFIFSTAMSPLTAIQAKAAIQWIIARDEGTRLLAKADKFKKEIQPFADVSQSHSQIIPVIVGSNEKCLALAALLRQRGFETKAVRSPTVRKGTERLRLTLKSYHTSEQLRMLASALREGIKDAS